MNRFLVVAAVIALAGCAAGTARVESMIPSTQGALTGSPLHGEVSPEPLTVSFPTQSEGLQMDVGSAEFDLALERSLAAAGLLAVERGRYALDAVPLRLSHDGGFERIVTVVIDYRVTDLSNGRVVFDEVIETDSIVPADANFFDADRLLYGAEAAISRNLAELVRQLAAVRPG